ncbi:MAG: DMT family transporter [Saprospiraceae bacterium]|nr:DMT family transporter [Saprospiraceae bacterium]
MLFLLLTVLCSVALGFLFKLFGRWGVDGFQAIVFNYFTCVFCGWIHLGQFPIQQSNFNAPWMPYALILGLIFISGFNLAAQTVRHFGVTIGAIMQKMSILMTVPFAMLVYDESSGWTKITGFILALAAIVLVNWTETKKNEDISILNKTMWWIPLLTWVLSGFLEVLFVKVQKENLANTADPTFIITIFATAGCIGLVTAIIGYGKNRLTWSWKNLAGGIALGIPNYGSMVFMLWALNSGLEGSFVFPVANVGIILFTTIGAVTLFHEKLSLINWLGIGFALGAIALISFG